MNLSSEVLQLRKEMSRLQRRVEYLETKLDLTRRELKPAGHKHFLSFDFRERSEIKSISTHLCVPYTPILSLSI